MLRSRRILFWIEPSKKCAYRYVRNAFKKQAVIRGRALGREEGKLISLLKLNIRLYKSLIGPIVKKRPRWRLPTIRSRNNLRKPSIKTYKNLSKQKSIYKANEIQMLLRFKLILKVWHPESNRLPVSGRGQCRRNRVFSTIRLKKLNPNCRD